MPGSATANGGAQAGSSCPVSATVTTLYDVMGVSQTATTEEITLSYRKLALDYHPDRAGGSTEKFQELQRAYEVLKNPSNRAKYDALLKGKPMLKGFKRPPKLERVETAVYALLADLAFYEFESSASKLRCSFHYGDGIEYGGERGSFIGLAGDGYLYWTVNARGYATQLCQAESSMSLSNIRVVYRSNMGLSRKPLERSKAGNYVPPQQQQQQPAGSRSSTRQSGASTPSASSPLQASMAGGAGRMSEAERLRQQIRNKERHRSATKRLETIEREETEERDELQQQCWEDFYMLHTNLEACMRCVRLGLPVNADFALFMGYASPHEVPLHSPPVANLPAAAAGRSPQLDDLWVDPLVAGPDSADDDEVEDNSDLAKSDPLAARSLTQQQQQRRRQSQPQTPPSPSDSPARSMSASDSDSAASDGDSCRARPTAAPQTFHEARHPTAAAGVSSQPAGSAPLVPGAVRPMLSSASSPGLGQSSPAHPRAKSWGSSPGAYALPAATVAATAAAATTNAAAPAKGATADLSGSPHAPQTLHTPATAGHGGGAATVQYTGGLQRASMTSLSLEGDTHHKSATPQGSGRASRGCLLEPEQPASHTLLRPLATGQTAQSGGTNTSPLDTKESSATERYTLGPAAMEHPRASWAASRDGTATPPRPMYPWSTERGAQQEAQIRRSLHEAIPDPSPGAAAPLASSVERDRTRDCSTSPPAVASTPARGREGEDSVAARGLSTAHTASPSPSPMVTRDKTPAVASAPGLAATPAEATHGRFAQPSPPLDTSGQSPAVVPAASPQDQRVLRARPSLSSAVRTGVTPENDASLSPRLQHPVRSAEPHKAGWSVNASGRSLPLPSMSHGDSGELRGSAISGATAGRSQDDALRVSGQDSPHGHGLHSAAGHETPSRYLDVTVDSSGSPPSAPAGRQAAQPSDDFIIAAETAGAPPLSEPPTASASTAGLSTGPRVALAPLRLASVSRDFSFQRSGQEADGEAAAPLSPDAQAAERRKRAKGRVTPRYMLATEAHVRRSSQLPPDVLGNSIPAQSPRIESAHAYSSMTVEEMLAQEEEFMNSFSKTKRVL